MEEVVGSIPTRSTKSPNNLDGAKGHSLLLPGALQAVVT